MSRSRVCMTNQLLFFYALTDPAVETAPQQKQQHFDKIKEKYPHHEKRPVRRSHHTVHQPAARGMGRK